MSLQLINQYYSKLERIVQYGGSRNEQSVRGAFQQLLENYANTQNLELIAELEYRANGSVVYPDGTLKDALRQSRGYWESKDQYDDLDTEIAKKFAKGYPDTNILFDDSKQVALYQNGQEVGRAQMEDAATLDALLSQFVRYEPPQIKQFRDAIDGFKDDLPDLLVEIRKVIEDQARGNARFVEQRDRLLELVQKAINPHLGLEDVREMLIQHILTEEIFTSVFNESQFHRENNVAHELHNVTETFFTGALRRNTLLKIEPYYNVIKAAAANIANHHEKQKFLKVVYETFYQAYNPAAADRLGIVYTPNEIVRFMIEAADFLTHKHFGKFLGDEGVNILDPATGTGTFITEIIEYLPKHQLERKYRHELFCNEVALLPYYTANLNIEYTYQQKMGEYAEFENIAFVDTLENLNYVGAVGQGSIFEMTAENLERIKRQNTKKISVIIGNPPYNAYQQNFNNNNKKREYPLIDNQIEETYVKYSDAQKTSAYDMYTRFLRWASNRLNQNGVIAFVVNRSFVSSRAYDGLRRVLEKEFNEIHIIDLKGDSRTLGEEAKRQGGNVFGVRVGVAIGFLVKSETEIGCKIYYDSVEDFGSAEQKRAYLRDNAFTELAFRHIVPDSKANWINQAEHEWEDLLPLSTKQTKFAETERELDAVFKFSTPGVSTQRDEWVFDLNQATLANKLNFFVDLYNLQVNELAERKKEELDDLLDYSIKWSDGLKNKLLDGVKFTVDISLITKILYRPYTELYYYSEKGLSDRLTNNHYKLFGLDFSLPNKVLCVTYNAQIPFVVQVTNSLPSYDAGSRGGTQCLPLYRYDSSGNRLDNITAWGLKQFREHYGDETISREDIFHYTYGVLHDPAYREKYRLNLKREFPHIPFYADFRQWAAWGETLMNLHLNYETAEPYPLERTDADGVTNPKAKLKADKASGQIILDSQTVLSGVPAAAWEYKLGNRSALEWVLDRYKEKKPKDPTIREKFNTYRFADYKEEMIELLQRVCTVSVETVNIVRMMEGVAREVKHDDGAA